MYSTIMVVSFRYVRRTFHSQPASRCAPDSRPACADPQLKPVPRACGDAGEDELGELGRLEMARRDPSGLGDGSVVGSENERLGKTERSPLGRGKEGRVAPAGKARKTAQAFAELDRCACRNRLSACRAGRSAPRRAPAD